MIGALLLLSSLAGAVEGSAGVLLPDAHRPGARATWVWDIAETGDHTWIAGPDLSLYALPAVRLDTLTGGVFGWQWQPSALRVEAALGAGALWEKNLSTTFRIEDGALQKVPVAGRVLGAATARVGIGRGPTATQAWGWILRPTLVLELPRDTGPQPIWMLEVAGLFAARD